MITTEFLRREVQSKGAVLPNSGRISRPPIGYWETREITEPSDLTLGKSSVTKAPDFFIVGAPKCGTSAMAHYLGRHPDIYMAKKEMHTFGKDLRFSPQFYRRDLQAYMAEFDDRNGQRRAGEASVWYLFSTQAAAEIKAFNPRSSIIVMLRDPAEMLYSMYYQFRYDGNEHLVTFEEALAAEDDRRAGRRIPRHAHFAQGLCYRETARFTEQLRRYFETFGRERVHVIVYDDLVSNPAAVYRGTLEFLSLDSTPPDIDFKVINGNKSVKSTALRAILNERYLRSTVLAIRPWLPRFIFSALRGVDRRLWQLNTRSEKRPPLGTELRARLKREFAPEVEKLSNLLGRDLTHWSR
jgi:hypothetical protein